MINEESKQHWIRVGVIALITFLVSYLAFCLALKHHLKKAYNPFYQAEKMEKMLEKQAYDFDNYMLKKMENPFEPKMRPTMINLVKEGNGVGYCQEEYIKEELENGSLKKLNLLFTPPKLDIYAGYMVDTLAFAPKKFIEFLSTKD
jgi:hypothetical protein